MKQYKLLADQICEILAQKLDVPVERCLFESKSCLDLQHGVFVQGDVTVFVSEDTDETNK